MEQKLLLCGSILAVIVLILAGLSPVVSFNTAKSSAVSSPLFRVRTNRAVEQEDNGLNCAYIGQGDTFLFPKRDSNIKQMQLVVERIQGMDDETFNRFLESIVQRYRQLHTEIGISLETIITELIQIRKNPKDSMTHYILSEQNNRPIEITSSDKICDFLEWLIVLIYFTVLAVGLIILTRLNKCETVVCTPTTDCVPTEGCHL
jgi:hypothetical protein